MGLKRDSRRWEWCNESSTTRKLTKASYEGTAASLPTFLKPRFHDDAHAEDASIPLRDVRGELVGLGRMARRARRGRQADASNASHALLNLFKQYCCNIAAIFARRFARGATLVLT